MIKAIIEEHRYVTRTQGAAGRSERRYGLAPHGRLEVSLESQGQVASGLVLDVSRRGMGLMTKLRLRTGAVGVLRIGEHALTFEVAHSESHLGIEDQHRIGVFIRNYEIDLVDLLAKAGVTTRDI